MLRKNLVKTFALFIALILLVVTLAAIAVPEGTMSGTGLNAQPSAVTSNTTFTTAWFGTYIDTLNPFTSYSQLTNWINMNIYLPLVYFNAGNDTVEPGLATSWTINYTNHTAIFNLNPNAVWSDGTPVTAQDVVYSYNIAAQNYTFINQYVSAISNVTALGTHTVMMTFSGVLWEMWAAYVFVVPQHVWQNVDPSTYAGYSPNGTSYFVGDGPFVLTQYVVNQYAKIESNPKWFVPSEMPKIKTVIFQEFSSQSSAISALQSGSVQGLARILPANVGQFTNNTNYVVKVSPNLEYLYLSVNVDPNGTGNPALHNLTVRQAMAHAINTSYIANTVYHGYATTLNSVLAPTNLYYDHNIQGYSYNVSLANQMLNNTAYNVIKNGIRQDSSGNQLKFTILVPSGDTLAVSMATLIKQNLTAIGMSVTVSAETTGSMAATIWQSNGTLGQDMDLWDWFDNIQAAPQLLSVFLADQVVTGTSDSGFNNATFDTLWTQLLNASTPAQAQSISSQMQQILHEQLPYIPLVVPQSINVWSSAYTNVSAAMPGGPFGGGDWTTFITMQPPTSQQAAPDYTLYYIGGAIAVVIIGAIAAVVVMRRRGRDQ